MHDDFEKIFNEWQKTHEVMDKDKIANYTINDRTGNIPHKKNKKEALTLDLHRLNRSDALIKLKTFVMENQSSNQKKIIIIHGAGNHSKEKCVLKEAVKIWLKENTGLIKYFRPGKTDEGGFGATVAYIKSK